MNKTVLISGGASGIGKELTLEFSKNKDNIIVLYNKSIQNLDSIEKECRSNESEILFIKCCLSNIYEIEQAVNKSLKKFKNIDVLINNAGISKMGLITDHSLNDIDEIININLKGSIILTQNILKNMIKNKSGNIINISSIWGMTGSSCEVLYSTTKAGIIGFTKALAKEVGLSNIRVNCIAPGYIDTDMNKEIDCQTIKYFKKNTPLGVIGQPSDISNLAIFLASNKSKFITGQIISPNGGFLI